MYNSSESLLIGCHELGGNLLDVELQILERQIHDADFLNHRYVKSELLIAKGVWILRPHPHNLTHVGKVQAGYVCSAGLTEYTLSYQMYQHMYLRL